MCLLVLCVLVAGSSSAAVVQSCSWRGAKPTRGRATTAIEGTMLGAVAMAAAAAVERTAELAVALEVTAAVALERTASIVANYEASGWVGILIHIYG